MFCSCSGFIANTFLKELYAEFGMFFHLQLITELSLLSQKCTNEKSLFKKEMIFFKNISLLCKRSLNLHSMKFGVKE